MKNRLIFLILMVVLCVSVVRVSGAHGYRIEMKDGSVVVNEGNSAPDIIGGGRRITEVRGGMIPGPDTESSSTRQIELNLGGSFMVDYRYYEEDCREDNRFDIRKARLLFTGSPHPMLRYRMELEFQGNDQKNLMDGYGEVLIHPALKFRAGQFKVPFSLEWQTPDQAILFAERSIGYSLAPGRDVGLMCHGSLMNEGVHYSLGIVNGDGTDGSTRGGQRDDPEYAARLVLCPFAAIGGEWLRLFQLGGSVTHARIDLANVDMEVKSTGMTGTNRSLYVLNANTKFGVLQGVEERRRHGLEGGWAWGPVAVYGEYVEFKYAGLEPSGKPPQDAEFSSWYVSALLFLTGESPQFKGGVLQPVFPKRDLDRNKGTLGAIGVATRMEHFSGDERWIKQDAHVSVREADAFSVALNWIPYPMVRLMLDYTRTDLSDPILVRRNPDGSINYIEEEQVSTLRLYISF
ncbi:MAG: OprO/OprP family phosphate-selective porin [bacterium]